MIPKVAQNMITKLEVLDAHVQSQQDEGRKQKRVLRCCYIEMIMSG